MTGAAVRRRPRHALKLWHRWFGLIAGLWLALLAVTGIAVTFYDELDSTLNADWRTVPVSADRVAGPAKKLAMNVISPTRKPRPPPTRTQ